MDERGNRVMSANHKALRTIIKDVELLSLGFLLHPVRVVSAAKFTEICRSSTFHFNMRQAHLMKACGIINV
jgi:hypothetical protein